MDRNIKNGCSNRHKIESHRCFTKLKKLKKCTANILCYELIDAKITMFKDLLNPTYMLLFEKDQRSVNDRSSIHIHLSTQYKKHKKKLHFKPTIKLKCNKLKFYVSHGTNSLGRLIRKLKTRENDKLRRRTLPSSIVDMKLSVECFLEKTRKRTARTVLINQALLKRRDETNLMKHYLNNCQLVEGLTDWLQAKGKADIDIKSLDLDEILAVVVIHRKQQNVYLPTCNELLANLSVNGVGFYKNILRIGGNSFMNGRAMNVKLRSVRIYLERKSTDIIHQMEEFKTKINLLMVEIDESNVVEINDAIATILKKIKALQDTLDHCHDKYKNKFKFNDIAEKIYKSIELTLKPRSKAEIDEFENALDLVYEDDVAKSQSGGDLKNFTMDLKRTYLERTEFETYLEKNSQNNKKKKLMQGVNNNLNCIPDMQDKKVKKNVSNQIDVRDCGECKERIEKNDETKRNEVKRKNSVHWDDSAYKSYSIEKYLSDSVGGQHPDLEKEPAHGEKDSNAERKRDKQPRNRSLGEKEPVSRKDSLDKRKSASGKRSGSEKDEKTCEKDEKHEKKIVNHAHGNGCAQWKNILPKKDADDSVHGKKSLLSRDSIQWKDLLSKKETAHPKSSDKAAATHRSKEDPKSRKDSAHAQSLTKKKDAKRAADRNDPSVNRNSPKNKNPALGSANDLTHAKDANKFKSPSLKSSLSTKDLASRKNKNNLTSPRSSVSAKECPKRSVSATNSPRKKNGKAANEPERKPVKKYTSAPKDGDRFDDGRRPTMKSVSKSKSSLGSKRSKSGKRVSESVDKNLGNGGKKSSRNLENTNICDEDSGDENLDCLEESKLIYKIMNHEKLNVADQKNLTRSTVIKQILNNERLDLDYLKLLEKLNQYRIDADAVKHISNYYRYGNVVEKLITTANDIRTEILSVVGDDGKIKFAQSCRGNSIEDLISIANIIQAELPSFVSDNLNRSENNLQQSILLDVRLRSALKYLPPVAGNEPECETADDNSETKLGDAEIPDGFVTALEDGSGSTADSDNETETSNKPHELEKKDDEPLRAVDLLMSVAESMKDTFFSIINNPTENREADEDKENRIAGDDAGETTSDSKAESDDSGNTIDGKTTDENDETNKPKIDNQYSIDGDEPVANAKEINAIIEEIKSIAFDMKTEMLCGLNSALKRSLTMIRNDDLSVVSTLNDSNNSIITVKEKPPSMSLNESHVSEDSGVIFDSESCDKSSDGVTSLDLPAAKDSKELLSVTGEELMEIKRELSMTHSVMFNRYFPGTADGSSSSFIKSDDLPSDECAPVAKNVANAPSDVSLVKASDLSSSESLSSERKSPIKKLPDGIMFLNKIEKEFSEIATDVLGCLSATIQENLNFKPMTIQQVKKRKSKAVLAKKTNAKRKASSFPRSAHQKIPPIKTKKELTPDDPMIQNLLRLNEPTEEEGATDDEIRQSFEKLRAIAKSRVVGSNRSNGTETCAKKTKSCSDQPEHVHRNPQTKSNIGKMRFTKLIKLHSKRNVSSAHKLPVITEHKVECLKRPGTAPQKLARRIYDQSFVECDLTFEQAVKLFRSKAQCSDKDAVANHEPSVTDRVAKPRLDVYINDELQGVAGDDGSSFEDPDLTPRQAAMPLKMVESTMMRQLFRGGKPANDKFQTTKPSLRKKRKRTPVKKVASPLSEVQEMLQKTTNIFKNIRTLNKNMCNGKRSKKTVARAAKKRDVETNAEKRSSIESIPLINPVMLFSKPAAFLQLFDGDRRDGDQLSTRTETIEVESKKSLPNELELFDRNLAETALQNAVYFTCNPECAFGKTEQELQCLSSDKAELVNKIKTNLDSFQEKLTKLSEQYMLHVDTKCLDLIHSCTKNEKIILEDENGDKSELEVIKYIDARDCATDRKNVVVKNLHNALMIIKKLKEASNAIEVCKKDAPLEPIRTHSKASNLSRRNTQLKKIKPKPLGRPFYPIIETKFVTRMRPVNAAKHAPLIRKERGKPGRPIRPIRTFNKPNQRKQPNPNYPQPRVSTIVPCADVKRATPTPTSSIRKPSEDELSKLTIESFPPIQSEYPRRDHRVHTSIENTFLYKLVYDEYDQNLMEPHIKCSNDRCSFCSVVETKDDDSKEPLNCHLGAREKAKAKFNFQKYWKDLQVRYGNYHRTYTACPLSVNYPLRKPELPSTQPSVQLSQLSRVTAAKGPDNKIQRNIEHSLLRSASKANRQMRSRASGKPATTKPNNTKIRKNQCNTQRKVQKRLEEELFNKNYNQVVRIEADDGKLGPKEKLHDDNGEDLQKYINVVEQKFLKTFSMPEKEKIGAYRVLEQEIKNMLEILTRKNSKDLNAGISKSLDRIRSRMAEKEKRSFEDPSLCKNVGALNEIKRMLSREDVKQAAPDDELKKKKQKIPQPTSTRQFLNNLHSIISNKLENDNESTDISKITAKKSKSLSNRPDEIVGRATSNSDQPTTSEEEYETEQEETTVSDSSSAGDISCKYVEIPLRLSTARLDSGANELIKSTSQIIQYDAPKGNVKNVNVPSDDEKTISDTTVTEPSSASTPSGCSSLSDNPRCADASNLATYDDEAVSEKILEFLEVITSFSFDNLIKIEVHLNRPLRYARPYRVATVERGVTIYRQIRLCAGTLSDSLVEVSHDLNTLATAPRPYRIMSFGDATLCKYVSLPQFDLTNDAFLRQICQNVDPKPIKTLMFRSDRSDSFYHAMVLNLQLLNQRSSGRSVGASVRRFKQRRRLRKRKYAQVGKKRKLCATQDAKPYFAVDQKRYRIVLIPLYLLVFVIVFFSLVLNYVCE